VKQLKDTNLDDLEDVLVIWVGQVNARMEQQLMTLLRNE
jgi:hypothetical protein